MAACGSGGKSATHDAASEDGMSTGGKVGTGGVLGSGGIGGVANTGGAPGNGGGAGDASAADGVVRDATVADGSVGDIARATEAGDATSVTGACDASYCDPTPPSTLLPAGSTSVDFSLTTGAPAHCTWSIGDAAQVTAFAVGEGTTAHGTTIVGLSADTKVVNEVYVRCDSGTGWPLHLRYRALPAVNPSYPRIGNLWGSWEVQKSGGIPHCARIAMWLGAGFTEAEIAQLRGLNPNVLVLGSINTVERNGEPEVPESAYLHDTKGKRIEVWPGAWRVNLTRPEVATMQARFAYDQILAVNLAQDGMFFDNFFTSQSWVTKDYKGNPVDVDADGDGKLDDPAWLDAAWRAGVFAELAEWRKLMPYAFASGHLPRPPTADFGALFNGDSIGFEVPEVIEARRGFADLWDAYHGWWSVGRQPVIPMIEGAPPYQIGYGYGYEPMSVIPAGALEFGRTVYRNMRFGLGVTLTNDGFYAYELGDTFHGNDWWYDEFDADLGAACGPARRVAITGAEAATDHLRDGGFEATLATNWSLWADNTTGAEAAMSSDSAQPAAGAKSARVDVSSAGDATDWKILFSQSGISVAKGVSYDLVFSARASAARTMGLNLQKGADDWRSYGLSRTVDLGTAWTSITVTFEATETAADARLGFEVGASVGTVWLDEISLREHPADVFRRDFQRGAVVLNGTRIEQTVTLGAGLARLTGAQAPRYQTIIDDADVGFAEGASWQAATHDSGIWMAAGPYFHDWAGGSHELASGGDTAEWDLGLRSDDTYTISAWWAAAPAATGWTKQAVFEVVSGGVVVASKTLDQSSGGDSWHALATLALKAADKPRVRISNGGAGTLVADALLLESQARWNDGSAAASVTLAAMDAIVLRRTTGGCP
jgi:hypothetical protein